MKKLKVLKLIACLRPKEKKEISEQLWHESKDHLYLLFKTLATDGSDPTREKVFRKLYNRDYTKKEDYLLRNAFRNLTERIEGYLAHEEMTQAVQNNLNLSNYFLLKSMQERKMFDLFDFEYKKAVKKATSGLDFQLASAICSLGFNNHLMHHLPDQETYQGATRLNDLQLAYLSAFYLNTYRKTEFNKILLKNMISPGTAENTLTEKPKVDFRTYENDLSKYLYFKSALFVAAEEDKINVLNHCLKMLQNLKVSKEVLTEERLFCNTVLALEYAQQGEYAKAEALYQEIFKDCDVGYSMNLQNAICDYLVMLIRQDYTERADKEAAGFAKYFASSGAPFIRFRMLNITLMALRGDVKRLSKELPRRYGRLPEYQQHFYRFMYAILSYLKGDYESAQRECINFRNVLRYKVPDLDIRSILKFFLKYFNLLNKGKIKYDQGVLLLKKEVQAYNLQAPREVRNYLPLFWLLRHL